MDWPSSVPASALRALLVALVGLESRQFLRVEAETDSGGGWGMVEGGRETGVPFVLCAGVHRDQRRGKIDGPMLRRQISPHAQP